MLYILSRLSEPPVTALTNCAICHLPRLGDNDPLARGRQDVRMDATPDELESLIEFAARANTGSIAGTVVQGLDLTAVDLANLDVDGALFLGCRLASHAVEADLVLRGAQVVRAFTEVPYPSHPSTLYTSPELAAGFDAGSFASMFDTRVYAHFVKHGGPLPDIREALAQRLHDHGIDDALGDLIDVWGVATGGRPVIGVMGGHAEPRGSRPYVEAAELGRGLARAGALVLTGGGPGVMEAANLGAYLANQPDDALPAAIADLATAPDFHNHDPYTAAALAVRARWPLAEHGTDPVSWARGGGLSIPTWLYGHEPANLFAGRIAKYFSNAIREDTILRVCRGGIVFAPGKAGTVQEVFQSATKAYYGSDGASGPMVFLDRAYWTDVLPVESLLRPLFGLAADPVLDKLVHLTDDVDEAIAILTP
jgi:predicted Rossmann-fold nucleotide-binding protein